MSETIQVVMLHDRGHGDFHKVRTSMGLEAPLYLQSFTDTLEEQNKNNGDLHRSVFYDADLLVIQDHLVEYPTRAAQFAIDTALSSSVRQTQLWLFDSDYNVLEYTFEDFVQFEEAQ